MRRSREDFERTRHPQVIFNLRAQRRFGQHFVERWFGLRVKFVGKNNPA